MFSLRALSSTLLVLLMCGFALAQHEIGGGATSGSATSDSGRGGSVRVRRAPTRPVTTPRRPRPAGRALTAEQYNQQGDALFASDQYEDALEMYQKAVQLKPIATAYYHIGWIYNERDDYDQALAALLQATRLNSNYAMAYDELGYSYRHLKRYDEALVAYRRSIALDPSSARAHFGLGWTCNEIKRYADAVQPLRTAITLKPNYPEAFAELGYALRRTNRYQDAISAYRQAMALKSDFADAYFGLGDVYFYNTSQYPEATASRFL
jgi:tetratricopeptide (TPR) repeat protein